MGNDLSDCFKEASLVTEQEFGAWKATEEGGCPDLGWNATMDLV